MRGWRRDGWRAACGALAVLAVGCSSRATPPPEASAPAAAAPESPENEVRPLTLWRVEKEGLEPSYLFGTCHFGVSLAEALPAEMMPLLTEADLLVLEVDPGELVVPDVMARLRLPEGQTVRQILGEEDWERAVNEFGLGEQAATLDNLHPYVLVSMMQGQVMQRSIVTLNRSGGSMDLALSGAAQRAGREQAWLETAHDQLDVFLGQPMEAYADGVRQMMDPDAQQELVRQTMAILDVCRTGDTGPALEVLAASDGDFMRALLEERNRRWIPTLEDYFQRGQVFAAAGAGHMIGPHSVVELLRERGYTVEQLEGTTEASPAAEVGGTRLSREQFVATIAEQLPALLCSARQPFLSCFQLDVPACHDAFSEAVHTCGARMDLPDPIPPDMGQALGSELGGCSGSEVMTRYRDQLLTTPECAVFAE